VVKEGREEEVRGVISQDDAILQLELFGKMYNITVRGRRGGGREGGREGRREGQGEGPIFSYSKVGTYGCHFDRLDETDTIMDL